LDDLNRKLPVTLQWLLEGSSVGYVFYPKIIIFEMDIPGLAVRLVTAKLKRVRVEVGLAF